MYFDDLSSELKEKLSACKTVDELRGLAKSVGIDLSDEELMSCSGGDGECIPHSELQRICPELCPYLSPSDWEYCNSVTLK